MDNDTNGGGVAIESTPLFNAMTRRVVELVWSDNADPSRTVGEVVDILVGEYGQDAVVAHAKYVASNAERESRGLPRTSPRFCSVSDKKEKEQ